jgi:hypothetical protein
MGGGVDEAMAAPEKAASRAVTMEPYIMFIAAFVYIILLMLHNLIDILPAIQLRLTRLQAAGTFRQRKTILPICYQTCQNMKTSV